MSSVITHAAKLIHANGTVAPNRWSAADRKQQASRNSKTESKQPGGESRGGNTSYAKGVAEIDRFTNTDSMSLQPLQSHTIDRFFENGTQPPADDEFWSSAAVAGAVDEAERRSEFGNRARYSVQGA